MKNKKTSQFYSSHWFIYFLAVLALTAAAGIYSQGKELPPFNVYYSNSKGNVNNPELSTVQPPPVEKSAREIELESQLESARISNNTIAANRIQEQLDKLHGAVLTPLVNMAGNMEIINTPVEQGDYNQTTIHSLSIMSSAIATVPSGAPTAGKLWYATTVYSGNGADTLKLYNSTNNGTSWIYYSQTTLNYNYDYRRDEIDMELVYDGTDVWMFIVIGLDDITNGGTKCEFIRYNTTTPAGVWISILSFPGSSSSTRYYNPRITSDNSIYTSNTYVMVLCSLDSTSGSNHTVKQKYGLLTAPFAGTVSFNYQQPSGTNGFYWMGNNGTNGSAYLYGDIAYYRDDNGTGSPRVMTVYGNYGSGFNNIYIAYLSGYSTFGSSLAITEPNINKDVKIAFNGGSNNRNGMVTYVRQFSNTDWDIFGARTTDGGSTIGSWTRDTIDFSSDRARTCDLASVRNASNQFKIVYTQDNPSAPAAFYKTFNGSWSSKMLFSNGLVDTSFSKPRVGYILGGGDDGFGVWSSLGGYNAYFSKSIQSTTGIQNTSEIPSGFLLSQNYPNPFNPVTNIKFSIPQTGIVTLKVYDITGMEVASLISQNMNAGSYTVDFDASRLSSGAYFYRLSSNGFTDVKKMILVK